MVSVSNCTSVLCLRRNIKEKSKVVELEHELIRRAIRLGGTVSGEHGVGVGKMEHIIEEHGEVHIDLQRRIKRALDPRNIMNPNSYACRPCAHVLAVLP